MRTKPLHRQVQVWVPWVSSPPGSGDCIHLISSRLACVTLLAPELGSHGHLAAAGAGLEASLHTATDRRLNNHLPSLHTDCESCFYSADCHPSIHNKFGKTTNGGEMFGVTIIAMDKVR